MAIMAAKWGWSAIVVGVMASGLARADERESPKPAVTLENKIEPIDDKTPPKFAVTHHTTQIAGETVAYTATAGTLTMKAGEDKEKAEIFFIAYTRDGMKHVAERPVTFCFNGGPGSSSVWLHVGMLGPKRIQLNEDATPVRPPGKLVENTYSLLDRTDLVFIDPVSTGFSRPAKDEDKKQFHGYDEDLRSVGEFIYFYTSRYDRWLSPKFLLGESYGTLRAAGLSGYLQDRYYLDLNGIILISSVLDFRTLDFSVNNDLAHILFLPSYTATAWYHKQLGKDLQRQELEKVLVEVEEFAMNDYADALLKGVVLPKSQRQNVIQKLSRYTGLSSEYIEQSNLRIRMDRFGKELLRNKERIIGRFDSRYQGIALDPAGESYDYDASAAALFGPFTAALNHYLRTELEVDREKVYEILTGNVHPWNYERFENRYVEASATLRKAMAKNPLMKVFVASGYYDLATPYFATDYTFNHLALEDKLRKNVSTHYYPAGHMMYVHEPSLKKLRRDLEHYYRSALAK